MHSGRKRQKPSGSVEKQITKQSVKGEEKKLPFRQKKGESFPQFPMEGHLVWVWRVCSIRRCVAICGAKVIENVQRR
jgi:hypothetical protein